MPLDPDTGLWVYSEGDALADPTWSDYMNLLGDSLRDFVKSGSNVDDPLSLPLASATGTAFLRRWGRVRELTVVVTSGSFPVGSTVLIAAGVMPVGDRPPGNARVGTAYLTGSNNGLLVVNGNGRVDVNHATGATRTTVPVATATWLV